MSNRLPLTTTVAAALCAVAIPVSAARASNVAHDYKVSVKGEQVTTWSYSGHQPGDCKEPRHGTGREQFDFRSAPVRTTATTAGYTPGKPWVAAVDVKLKAVGSRTGRDVVGPAECPVSGHEDAEPAPTKDCGDAHWTIDASLQYGIDHPLSNMILESGAGDAASGRSLFADCPWFAGPDDDTYQDQSGAGTIRSNDLSNGLRWSAQRVSEKTFRTGRSFDVSRKLVKDYRFKDEYGRLTGRTTIRWTATFRAVRSHR